MFSIIILDFVTLGFPILFSSGNKTFKPPRLKLNSKCFSANPLSPILVTVCLDAYDLDFPLTFVFAVSSTLREPILAFPSLTMFSLSTDDAFTSMVYVRLKRYPRKHVYVSWNGGNTSRRKITCVKKRTPTTVYPYPL